MFLRRAGGICSDFWIPGCGMPSPFRSAGKSFLVDYRMLAFRRNFGLRIDHILLTPTSAADCRAAR